jgi:peptidoglycan/LPS O-acetylase OafA/YrhL
VPVLLFHAHVPGLPGGYVGVDIFFVISGYLITGIISREMDQRRFSLLRFYERRARRILPALALMIVVVLAAAAWLYLPGDFEGVPRSALAATLSLSNLYFYATTGYFAGGADTKPLLHTWSLAVEEQFYLAFPLLLMLVARFLSRWRTAILTVAALASLALSVAMAHDISGFAFYLPATRAWELLAGGLLALGAVPPIRGRIAREGLPLAGLGAIACAIILFDRDTPFPGSAALLPVLGAASLLHAAPGTMAGRLLSLPPLRWVGLISYSLYLWHWPVIVFAEYATDTALSGWRAAGAIALAVLLATLSWRVVERPFRDSRNIPTAALFRMAGGAITALVALALAMIASGPWASRFSPSVLALAAASGDVSPMRKACHDTALRGAEPCLLGSDGPPTAILWGDSHGVEMAYALSRQTRLMQVTTSSCPPVLDWGAAKDRRCATANRATFDMIRADKRLTTVYLAAFWGSGQFADPAALALLDRTIAALRAQKRAVLIIGAVPPQHFDVPRRLAHLVRAARLDSAAGRDPAPFRSETAGLRALFARWQAHGVQLIDPMDALCDDRECRIIADGRPLYFDSHHLSVTGARYVLRGAIPPPSHSPRAVIPAPRH